MNYRPLERMNKDKKKINFLIFMVRKDLMKPLKITEHIPVHAFGFSEAQTLDFHTTEELLSIDFVKSHIKQEGFSRYSIHVRSGKIRAPLLAEYNNGKQWFVIGFLDGDLTNVVLPEWKPIATEIAN